MRRGRRRARLAGRRAPAAAAAAQPAPVDRRRGRAARRSELAARYATVAVGYADCGTYGALDELCDRRGWRRLAGLHCYDLYAGSAGVEKMFADQPGTYVLTDFLVRSFDRTVVAELGLDRHPELRDDYFGHYTRVVWLAQDPDPALHALATAAAERLGLPLTVVDTGHQRLARALETLLPPS